MRDRVLTPFLPVFCGVGTTDLGVESPGGGVPGRALEGSIVGNGRYLLCRKTGHTRTTIRFAAQDLMAGLELDLHVHPDPEAQDGYRVGRAGIAEPRDLPNLCSSSFRADVATVRVYGVDAAGPLRRFWAALRSLLGARQPL